MKTKVDVVVIEAGTNYMDKVKTLETRYTTVEEAIQAVTEEGFTVIPNVLGGQNEHCGEYIVITVEPK